MTTQAEFISKIRLALNEITGARFSDAQLRDWLNDAADDAASRCQCLRTTGTVAAVVGQQEYTPAFTDLLTVHAVKYVATGQTNEHDLEYCDYKSVAAVPWNGLGNTQGTPQLYWTWGFPPELEINVYPIPSVVGTFTVHYYKTFDKLALDDSDEDEELGFPSGWDRMLVNYAVSMALLSDRDDRHQTYMGYYEAQLAGFMQTTTRYNDQAGAVTPGGLLVPHWLYAD